MSQDSDHEVRRDETAVLIDEHNAVSVAVKDDSNIRLRLSDELLQILYILLYQRIRLMIREASVHLFIDVRRLVAEYVAREKRSHSVGHVHGDLQRRPVTLVFEKEGKIIRLYIHWMNLTTNLRRDTLASALDPLLDLAQACVKTNRKRVFTRNLKAVVLCRIMRGSDLHRSLESIIGCTEIHHRSRAEAYVIYISTSCSKSLQKILMYLRRRNTGVPSHKHLVC